MSRRGLRHRLAQAIALTGLGLMATALPVRSAEEIIFTYGFFERTVAIADLEAFANGEGLSRQLSEYAATLELTEAELMTIETVLSQRADISEVDVSRFLYGTQGTTLLEFIGEVIQTPTRQSGFKAIRGGLILAAADDENGLTILNFLKKYPTPAIRIDLGKGLEIATTVTDKLGDSERAIALVQTLAQEAALVSPISDLSSTQQLVYDLPEFAVATEPLDLPFRAVQATLFLPQPRRPGQSLPAEIPVIVISHGLGDERESYEYVATFLASRGFAVATLDHPGSNSAQIAQVLAGLSPNIIESREFLARPADVSALLDEIQRFASRDLRFRFRLDTRNVGLIGQSFGGYTALALAGATYDAEALEAACAPQPIYLNPSLLLQCEADSVAVNPPLLQDDRVKAIFVVNPVGSGIFGSSGFGQLQVPVMIMAATGDTVAPALPEQIEPFTWLQNEYRYLALVSGTTHFSVIDWNSDAEASIPVPLALLGDRPDLAQDYLQNLSLAFFQRHLRQDLRYDAALTSQFVQDIVARSPLMPLSLIRDLPPDQLDQALNDDQSVGDTAEE
ncbi:MAG: alpha/beta fold hydrolase [Cyanobacteria bacterium P01_E01_bin.43]